MLTTTRYESGRPATTGSGESDLVMPRSACDFTVTVFDAELLALLDRRCHSRPSHRCRGSRWSPADLDHDDITFEHRSPTRQACSGSATAAFPGEPVTQDTAGGVTETIATPAGHDIFDHNIDSRRRPELVTVSVYVRLVPATTESGVAVLVILKSASPRTVKPSSATLLPALGPGSGSRRSRGR